MKTHLTPVPPLASHELDLDSTLDEWRSVLIAANKSPNTVATYGYAVASLRAYAVSKRWELDLAQMTPKRLRAWQSHVLATRSDATAWNYHHGLKALYKWLVEEGELDESPLDHVEKPSMREKATPVISLANLRELVETRTGDDFRDVRDLAILRLFIDTGVRLAELTNIELADIDKRAHSIVVTGKTGTRTVHFGPKAAVALNRYLRLRARHPKASVPNLWVGRRGVMTRSGIYQVVRMRAELAGFVVHPHQFRHTFAHEWKLAGGNDSELMAFCGWRTATMLVRYGQSAANERARVAHERLALGERV